jgi:EAL domain-containing protein (putative c-di-GMP-specific phosphodiesterase class I)
MSTHGHWVARSACLQLAKWQAAGLNPVPVAINVTGRQLHDLNFPQRIANKLATCGVTAEWLEVEIIESSLMQSIELAIKVLSDLARIGIRIALDEFGNGYSSHTYFRTLPIHTFKIDCSFINDIRNSPQDATIVGSIVTVAHKLEMQVVAEGVELIDQLLHLKSINCDQVQGYFLSHPVDAHAAGKLIHQSILTPPK